MANGIGTVETTELGHNVLELHFGIIITVYILEL